jgi:hypothetical protein
MSTSPNPHGSLASFYQFYLLEHANLRCRQMHFIGSSAGLLAIAATIVFKAWIFILLGLLAGYGCAWVGHFFFEKNKPASFKFPLRSFACDWIMYWHMWTGKVRVI